MGRSANWTHFFCPKAHLDTVSFFELCEFIQKLVPESEIRFIQWEIWFSLLEASSGSSVGAGSGFLPVAVARRLRGRAD